MKRGENPPIIDPSIELGLIGEQPKPEAPSRFNVEDWLEALELVAKHYRMPVSVQGTKLAAAADLNIDDKAKFALWPVTWGWVSGLLSQPRSPFRPGICRLF